MKNSLHLVLMDSDPNDTKVNISNWFNSTKWQHVLFTSEDLVHFTVMEDDEGFAGEHPFLIDLSENKNGVILHLGDPESSNMSINSDISKKVKTVLDYSHDMLTLQWGGYITGAWMLSRQKEAAC